MRTCDGVIRKCVVGGKSSTESSGERYTLSSIVVKHAPLGRSQSERSIDTT